MRSALDILKGSVKSASVPGTGSFRTLLRAYMSALNGSDAARWSTARRAAQSAYEAGLNGSEGPFGRIGIQNRPEAYPGQNFRNYSRFLKGEASADLGRDTARAATI